MGIYVVMAEQIQPEYKICEQHSNRFISNCYYCSIESEVALIKGEK